LQHGPTTSEIERPQSKKTQIPPEIQKHGPTNNNTGKSTSKKAQQGAKRHATNRDSSMKSPSEKEKSSEELSSDEVSSESQRKRKRKKHSKSSIPEEFKKAKPPTFDGEIKKGEEAEAWLLGLKKYFRVHDYSDNMKARVAIFNLNGKASIWWEDLKNVTGIHERKLTWKQFEECFRKKYLSERYYDGKIKEFHELKLGQLTMENYVNIFLELLRYVPYIKDEKVKMQHFLSGMPQYFQDWIEFDEPKTLEDTIRKEKCCYDQSKPEMEHNKVWKKKDKMGLKRKGFKSSRFKNSGKNTKSSFPTRSAQHQNFPTQSENKTSGPTTKRLKTQRKGH
jgi:hypothetical protein